MSWNSQLYWYAQSHGGQHFGESTENFWNASADYGAVLLLEHKGLPMVVNCPYTSGRYGGYGTAQVLLRCTLRGEYQLQISPKNMARQGLNRVMSQLDKGAERFGVDLYSDYGCPDVTEGRKIKTNLPEFTKLVLQSLELRNALLAAPRFGVRVGQSAPSFAPDHSSYLITAWASLSESEREWDLSEPDVWLEEEDRRKRMESSSFSRQLDALIGLAAAMQGAVTAWPVPESTPKNTRSY